MQVSDDSKVMFKCRKCRKTLFSEHEACDSHSQSIAIDENELPPCIPKANVYYLREDTLPEWARGQVEEGNWTKGKLFCPECGCRIGSFDFVGGAKCLCGEQVLPPLHVTSNKLDRQMKAAKTVCGQAMIENIATVQSTE